MKESCGISETEGYRKKPHTVVEEGRIDVYRKLYRGRGEGRKAMERGAV
jgi:hypothetical protein